MSAPSDFKFEVHGFLDSKEAFLRCAIAESLARSRVQPSGYSVAAPLRDVRLAGSLGELLAEQTFTPVASSTEA